MAVKVRFAPFFTSTRSAKLKHADRPKLAALEAAALEVLERFDHERAVRLLGVRAEFADAPAPPAAAHRSGSDGHQPPERDQPEHHDAGA